MCGRTITVFLIQKWTLSTAFSSITLSRDLTEMLTFIKISQFAISLQKHYSVSTMYQYYSTIYTTVVKCNTGMKALISGRERRKTTMLLSVHDKQDLLPNTQIILSTLIFLPYKRRGLGWLALFLATSCI